jgi:hypothetical protein
MPASLDGLAVSLPVEGHASRFTYRVGTRGYGIKQVCLNGVVLSGDELRNPYREAGVAVAMDAVRKLLHAGQNQWDIETL